MQPIRDDGESVGTDRISAIMATQPDRTLRVPEKELLRIAGIARSTWRDWVKAGLLFDRQGIYSRQDVLDAVVVTALRAALSLEDTRSAWQQVGSEIRGMDRLPTRLDVGFDHRFSHAVLMRTDRQVAAFVRHGRLFTVVPVADGLKLAAAAFDRILNR